MENKQEQPQESNRLELKYRDFLQITLINEVFKEGSTLDQRNQWMAENAKKVSDIIDGDSEEAVEIRRLAREEKYEEAAILLKELL